MKFSFFLLINLLKLVIKYSVYVFMLYVVMSLERVTRAVTQSR